MRSPKLPKIQDKRFMGGGGDLLWRCRSDAGLIIAHLLGWNVRTIMWAGRGRYAGSLYRETGAARVANGFPKAFAHAPGSVPRVRLRGPVCNPHVPWGEKRASGGSWGKGSALGSSGSSRLEHHTAAHCQLYSGCFKIVVFVFIFSVRLPNSGKPVAADTL